MWRITNLILLLSVLPVVVGCDFFKDAAPLPPPVVSKKKPVLSDDAYAPSVKRREPPKPVPTDSPDTPSRRVSLLQKEIDSHQIRRVRHSLAVLPDATNMVMHLQTAVRLVNDIYALQIHGNNPIWRQQIARSGTDTEKQYIALFFRPWCQVVPDALCNAVASLPNPETGTVFWPVDFGRADFDAANRMINAKELLSPYSLIVRDGPSRLRAVPYPMDSRFEALFGGVAGAFKKAADAASGAERTLLKRLSGIVTEGDMYTFGIDADILQGGTGEWRIYWHTDSTALDAFGIKRAFGLTVGRVHEPSQRRVQMVDQHIGDIRKEYEKIFSGDAPLIEIAPMVALTPLDVWLAAGSTLDAYGQVEHNDGVDANRHCIGLQFQEAARQKYLNLFSNRAIANGIALAAWADGVNLLNAAAQLAPESVRPRSADGTSDSNQQISAELNQMVLQAMRRTGALWLIRVTEAFETSAPLELAQRVAAVLTEFFHLQRTGAKNEQRMMNWLIGQLDAAGALEPIVDSGTERILMHADDVVSTGSALFERLNQDAAAGNLTALKKLLEPAGESHVLKTIADADHMNPVVFDFSVEEPQ